MNLFVIIYISIFFWLLPPIRQYGSKFFGYFLILALADPVLLAIRITGINSNFMMILFSVLAYLILRKALLKSVNNWGLNLVLIIGSFGTYFLSNMMVKFIFIIIHMLILFVIFKYTLQYIHRKRMINIFHFVLIFYEFSGITKAIAIICEVSNGTEFLIISALFQMLVALFFTIFLEESSKIRFSIRPRDEKF